MELLKAVIRDLTVVAVLCAFIELLLPEGSSRYPVRLIFGLYFVAVLLNPLVGAISDVDLTAPEFELPAGEDITYDATTSDEQLYAMAAQTLAAEISARCHALYEEHEFTATVTMDEGGVQAIRVQTTAAVANEAAMARDIKDELASAYGVERSKITVEAGED